MGFEGLKKFRESQSSGSKFLKIGKDESVRIRPLQELDTDSPNFSAKNGVAQYTKEWHNPEKGKFLNQIVDTMEEEGRCVGRELLAYYGWNGEDNGGRGEVEKNYRPDAWRPKEFMYLNVLVDNGKDEPYVAVAKFNMAPKAVQANALIATYENSEPPSVTNRWFKYEREGEGQFNTTYKLVALDKNPKDKFDVEAYELLDLHEAAPYVSYERQRAALGVEGPRESVVSEPARNDDDLASAAAASSINAEW